MAALGERATLGSHRAAELLAVGAEDAAHDVREEAQRALAVYLAAPAGELPALWSLLLASERQGLARRLAVAALARHGHVHGTSALARLVNALPVDAPVVTRVAARLALALSRSDEPPEPAVGWLYGW